MGLFQRKRAENTGPEVSHELKEADQERGSSSDTPQRDGQPGVLPTHNHNGDAVTKGVRPDGESGRSGFHPMHFFHVAWKSSCLVSSGVNVLWPFVPAAIGVHFARPELHVWIFALSYIAMVPAANLLGFAGQELARKLPKVAGILIETTLGGLVEIILFMVLIVKDDGTNTPSPGNLKPVIQAAILGSILANLLLCLGGCFFVGGLTRKEQTFHATISEVGSGLLLVAGFALLIPSAFYSALAGSTVAAGAEGFTLDHLHQNTIKISRATAIILIICFLVYMIYNAFSHDNIFSEILEADEEKDADRRKDLRKKKFTFTEAVLAIVVSLTFISLLAVFLVEEIEHIVELGVPDNFLGLILVPLVEKAAEHLTAVDEAWDNQIVSQNAVLMPVLRQDYNANQGVEFCSVPLPWT